MLRVQVGGVLLTKNCVSEEDTVGQRGSCGQTAPPQDSGFTVSSHFRGEERLCLGGPHPWLWSPPPVPTQLHSRKFRRFKAKSPPSYFYLRQKICKNSFKQRETTPFLLYHPALGQLFPVSPWIPFRWEGSISPPTDGAGRWARRASEGGDTRGVGTEGGK